MTARAGNGSHTVYFRLKIMPIPQTAHELTLNLAKNVAKFIFCPFGGPSLRTSEPRNVFSRIEAKPRGVKKTNTPPSI